MIFQYPVDCFLIQCLQMFVFKLFQEFAEQILADLIAQGLTGDQLLAEFKKTQKKVRPAVEAMLTQAEQAAHGESESYSYDDVFGAEEE